MTLKIAFSCDDVAPVPGFGLLWDNDPTLYLKKLNEEFGAKFTLFCIPMRDGNPQFSFDNNRVWVDKLKNTPYYEIALHGLTHKAQKPEWGAQEFLGLSPQDSEQRISEGTNIMRRCGIKPKGFKFPGWFIAPYHYSMLKKYGFEYVGDHFTGNRIVEQDGIMKVPYTFTTNKIWHDKYDDYIILHSHISPLEGNLNGWTKDTYEQTRQYLLHLKDKYGKLEFVFISELVEEQRK
jgi:hypothetical protein